MTYQDLLNHLQSFTSEQLEAQVIVGMGNDQDEFTSVEDIRLTTDEQEYTVENHPYLRIT